MLTVTASSTDIHTFTASVGQSHATLSTLILLICLLVVAILLAIAIGLWMKFRGYTYHLGLRGKEKQSSSSWMIDAKDIVPFEYEGDKDDTSLTFQVGHGW